MTQIVPSGGRQMEWIKDPEQKVEKTAQGMFDDDPQLDAIKDLPGMQDGIDELNNMAGESCEECPNHADIGNFGGEIDSSLENALEKVKDAALDVAEVAKKEIKENVTNALADKGVATVSEIVKEDKPADEVEEFEFEIPIEVDIPVSDESDETGKEEEHEEHEKSETKKEEDKEEEIPGVEGDEDDGVKKEGDKEAFASGKGMRRLAELSSDEAKELRHYWKDLLGFPPDYVDAMLKQYRA